VPWVAALKTVLDQYAAAAPDHEDWRAAFEADPSFGPLTSAEFPHEQVLDRAGFIDRVVSISYVAALTGEDRDAAIARLLAIPDEAHAAAPDGSIVVPYRTKAHWAA
jgi:hypothetical protein